MPTNPQDADRPAPQPVDRLEAAPHRLEVVVIGGGPAGLMAAEVLAAGGAQVDLYDTMPSVGRKFLLAGKGGLNLTHAEPFDRFVGRYGPRQALMEPLLKRFDADAVRAWAEALGEPTFVGTSQRVFPVSMKAAPLLRAWLHRLRASGVRLHSRHRWLGFGDEGSLRFDTPRGPVAVHAGATVLALGGASWARLGSDGAWWPLLQQQGVAMAPLKPSNCGFNVDWTPHFRERNAGAPLKAVALRWRERDGREMRRVGECVVTEHGLEGSLIYAASPALRDTIAAEGSVRVEIDLFPTRSVEELIAAIAHPRGPRSLSTHLKSRLKLAGVRAGLLYETLPREGLDDVPRLAAHLKAVPITLRAARPIDEAISTAGGVCFEALDTRLMVRERPGLFIAGEMLDWEAPTGGYLLTACLASGVAAGEGVLAWRAETAQAAT